MKRKRKRTSKLLHVLLTFVLIASMIPAAAITSHAAATIPDDAVSPEGVLTIPDYDPDYNYFLSMESHQEQVYDSTVSLLQFCARYSIPQGYHYYTVSVYDKGGKHKVNYGSAYTYTHEHSGTSYHAGNAPTCEMPGSAEYWDCSCGLYLDKYDMPIEEGDILLPALGHLLNDYDHDLLDHWKVCSRCDYTGEKEKHSLNVEGTCLTCGYTADDSSLLIDVTGFDIEGNYYFGSLYEGYGKQESEKITITNTGTAAQNNIRVVWLDAEDGKGPQGDQYFTIHAPESIQLMPGESQDFTIELKTGLPAGTHSGYLLIYFDIMVEGTVYRVADTHLIQAAISSPVQFTDVPDDMWYADAVKWAVVEGITSGMSDTLFDPDGLCTRAQAVTFLWRYYDCPTPDYSKNPFTDISIDDWYYDAVLWAVENGITKGTSETTFSPDDTCTRAQIVTILWRADGIPTLIDAANPFTDVSKADYFYDAVLWAVDFGVTQGMSATSFEPNTVCSRAQIVTFLYRYYTAYEPVPGETIPVEPVPVG